MKVRLTQDCEHGEKGKVLEIDPEKAEEFAAQGKSEPYVEPEVPAEDPAEVRPARIAVDAPAAPEPKAHGFTVPAGNFKVGDKVRITAKGTIKSTPPPKAAPKKGKHR